MQLSQEGIDLIKRFEGFSAEPYFCPGGKLTIGYGHVLNDAESATTQKITGEHAEQLLKEDIRLAEEAVIRLVSVPLTQHQFDALVSFVYNIGMGAFEKSTLLKLLNDNKLESSARQFDRWIYASGKKLEGLISRRKAEKAMFLGEGDI